MQYINNRELRQQLEAFNIDPEKIKDVHLRILSGQMGYDSFVLPKEMLRPPKDSDYDHWQDLDLAELRSIGQAAIDQGELALLWLNGGAATRYFNMKKVSEAERIKYIDELSKLTPEIIQAPKGVTSAVNNLSYLELKIKNLLRINPKLKVILMNSFVTDEQTEKHLDKVLKNYPELSREQFYKIVQPPLYPRFTYPDKIEEIDVFVGGDGKMSFAPGGHGDFLELIQDFFQANHWPEVKYLFFANIDNFGTTVSPEILGYHIKKGKSRTVELAAKISGDKGGAPCFVQNKLVIVEQMKFPKDFDQDQISTFNTNSFWFNLKDLLAYQEELPLIMAEKTVGEEELIQLEHFAGDINLDSAFLEAPREERFWPTKRYVDLLIYKEDPKFKRLLQKEYGVV